MGTRSEIWIKKGDDVVKLYKHWDGYPQFMMPYLKEYAEFAARGVGDQLHWLSYPEDVAALLIAFDYEDLRRSELGYYRPDIRPKGRINDFIEYVYVLELELRDLNEASWTVKCYKVKGLKEADAVGEGDLELRATFTAIFKLGERGVEVQVI